MNARPEIVKGLKILRQTIFCLLDTLLHSVRLDRGGPMGRPGMPAYALPMFQVLMGFFIGGR